MATSDAIKEAAKTLGLIQHKDKSDSELQQIILNNARLVAGIGTDPSSISQGYKLMGESEACNELLAQRNAERERIKTGKKKWVEELQKRKDDALLSLRAAATPNGQLVQAILEDEDSLSQMELAGWCDELASLDDEVLTKLLKDLVEDGVLAPPDKDGRYRLRVVCDADQQWSSNKSTRAISHSDIQQKELATKIMLLLEAEEEPMCAEDCVEAQELFHDGENTESVGRYSFDSAMREMMKAGILTRVFTVDRNTYYAPAIIGEGGRRQ